MAEIVNLNRVRKAAAKAGARRQADENAVKFGRTKAQRQLEAAQAEQAQARLAAHQRAAEEPGEEAP